VPQTVLWWHTISRAARLLDKAAFFGEIIRGNFERDPLVVRSLFSDTPNIQSVASFQPDKNIWERAAAVSQYFIARSVSAHDNHYQQQHSSPGMSSFEQDVLTMDVLSVVFFLIAGLWLLAALCYSLLVLCFMRMRANGQLGSMYEEDFGRVQLPCGDNWYIPLGCIFRRYARHLNLDDGERPTVRYISRTERRRAMEILLISEPAVQSKTKSTTTHATSRESVLRQCWQYCRWSGGEKSASKNDTSVTTTDRPNGAQGASSTIQMNTNSMPDLEMGDDNADNHDDESDTGPICSICLVDFADSDATTDNKVFSARTCSHQYHEVCILSWLQRQCNTDCPCCRAPLVSEEDVWSTVKRIRREKRKQLQKQLKNSQRRGKVQSARKRDQPIVTRATEDATERETGIDDTEVEA
jgi:Ring finger domain